MRRPSARPAAGAVQIGAISRCARARAPRIRPSVAADVAAITAACVVREATRSAAADNEEPSVAHFQQIIAERDQQFTDAHEELVEACKQLIISDATIPYYRYNAIRPLLG